MQRIMTRPIAVLLLVVWSCVYNARANYLLFDAVTAFRLPNPFLIAPIRLRPFLNPAHGGFIHQRPRHHPHLRIRKIGQQFPDRPLLHPLPRIHHHKKGLGRPPHQLIQHRRLPPPLLKLHHMNNRSSLLRHT